MEPNSSKNSEQLVGVTVEKEEIGYIPEECQYPTEVKGYQLLEQIGSGMGGNRVYKAKVLQGPHTDTHLAIKQILMNPCDKDDVKEQMQKEIRAMKTASSPHVCAFYCSFLTEESLWVIMKLAAGSLKDVLRWKYKGGFPEEEERSIARILYEALMGLDVLHKYRIIHRDIKSSNILYGEDGVILLADFGVSAILQSQEERRKTMAGTWHWMAPEVINPEDRGYDVQADIWSLGITAIELAYGEAPYGHERPTEVVVHISTDQPPSMDNPHTPIFIKPKFSNVYADFVSCCLKIEPTKRDSTTKLLSHKLFSNIKNEKSDLKRVLLEGIPPIEKRFAEHQEKKKLATQAKFANMNITPAKRSQNPSRPGNRPQLVSTVPKK